MDNEDTRISFEKPYLSVDKLCQLLRSKGVLIQDENYALDVLGHQISYFRLSGYWYWHKYIDSEGNKKIDEPGGLDAIIDRYVLDRKFRLILTELLEMVELQLRSVIVSEMQDENNFCLYDKSCFLDKFTSPPINKGREFNKQAESEYVLLHRSIETEVNRSQNEFIRHYKKTYLEYPMLPLWMAVEIMSFGSLSKLYSGLKRPLQRRISKHWSISNQFISSWLHGLVILRNCCAHHERIMHREFSHQFKLREEDKAYISGEDNSLKTFIYIALNLAAPSMFFSSWLSSFVDFLDSISENERGLYGLTDYQFVMLFKKS